MKERVLLNQLIERISFGAKLLTSVSLKFLVFTLQFLLLFVFIFFLFNFKIAYTFFFSLTNKNISFSITVAVCHLSTIDDGHYVGMYVCMYR